MEIRNDPIIKSLMKNVPNKIQNTFTDEQLQHLKLAIGAREWGKHKVDVRRVVRLFRYRYYFVFLAGRNRRRLTAEQKKAVLFGQATSLGMLISCSIVFVVMFLYLLKSAAGIDLFPNFSFGLWDWFNELV